MQAFKWSWANFWAVAFVLVSFDLNNWVPTAEETGEVIAALVISALVGGLFVLIGILINKVKP